MYNTGKIKINWNPINPIYVLTGNCINCKKVSMYCIWIELFEVSKTPNQIGIDSIPAKIRAIYGPVVNRFLR